MTIIIATWLGIFAVVTGLGAGVYAIYLRVTGNCSSADPDMFQLTWLGYATLIAICQFYSLFWPMNELSLILITALSVCSYFCTFRIIRSSAGKLFRLPFRYKIILLTLFTILSYYVAYSAFFTPVHYDTELYHHNAVKWASSYPAIPGIANLHDRLGLNSSFHLFAALLNSWIWEDRAMYLANGFLIVLILFQLITHIISTPLKSVQSTGILSVALFPQLVATCLGWNMPSFNTDIPSFILILATVFQLIAVDIKVENGFSFRYSMTASNQFSWFLVLALATVSYTTKMVAAPLLALLFPITLYLLVSFCRQQYSSSFSLRQIGVMYTLPCLLLTGLITRFIILTGCLVYPLPYGNLNLEWSVPPEQAANTLKWTLSWARMPGVPADEVFGNGLYFWLEPWLQNFSNNYLALVLLACGIIGLMLTLLLKSSRKPEYFPLYIGAAVGFLGIIYWFISAPDIRFGEIYFWIFAVTAVSPFLLRPAQRHRLLLVFISIPLVITVVTFRQSRQEIRMPVTYTEPPALFRLPAAARSAGGLVPVTINNGQQPALTVYKPTFSDQCGNSPLPCSNYLDENSPIALRTAGDLRSGFKIISK